MLDRHLLIKRNDENMLGIIDLVSIFVVIGSYVVIALKIRSELRESV